MGILYFGKNEFQVDRLVKDENSLIAYAQGNTVAEFSGIDWENTDIRWEDIEAEEPALPETEILKTRLEAVESALVMFMTMM